MKIVPFEPTHFFACEAQDAQAPHVQWMTPDIAEAAGRHFAMTAIDEDGVVGCAGIAPADDGSMIAWALFSPLLPRHALAVTRAVKASLDLFSGHKLVMHIHPEHAKAAAFAERLSFKFKEARADLHPGGALLHVYVREGQG